MTKEPIITNLHVDYRLDENYLPELFIKLLKDVLNCKTTYEITRKTNIAPPILSRIKSRKTCISDELLLFTHDLTGWTIREIKAYVGIPQFKSKAAEISARVLEEKE